MNEIRNGIECVLTNLKSATLTVSEIEDLFEDAESFTEGLSSMGKVKAVMTYVLHEYGCFRQFFINFFLLC